MPRCSSVSPGSSGLIATFLLRFHPLRCPHCQGEMEVWCIWHPTSGVIYDEGEVIKRGTYASSGQRAGP